MQMKYSDIISSAVGHHIDLSQASDEDKDRFCTAFEHQKADLYDQIFEYIVKKTGKEPTVDKLFAQIVARAKSNYFEPDDLNQIAYAAGFTGVDK
jgi:hypothetical protein